jgi:hypothetical protein
MHAPSHLPSTGRAWRRALAAFAAAGVAVAAVGAQPARPANAALAQAAEHHRRGVAHHDRRALNDASAEYDKALSLDPPRHPDAAERAVIRRFAPRLYTTADEPFPLTDFAVVKHPTAPLVAYHFFWQDDIDYPEDNDPCDHEVVWVRHSADGRVLEEVWTYFHGRLLAGGDAARRDAREHGMRPRIDVQWGKHGSLPIGWAAEPAVLENQKATWRALSKGRRLPDHPIGKRLGWPARFAGPWEAFVDYSRLVDPLAWLDRTDMAKVTRWNSATINRHFLAYNFRPKTEWPIPEESQ